MSEIDHSTLNPPPLSPSNAPPPAYYDPPLVEAVFGAMRLYGQGEGPPLPSKFSGSFYSFISRRAPAGAGLVRVLAYSEGGAPRYSLVRAWAVTKLDNNTSLEKPGRQLAENSFFVNSRTGRVELTAAWEKTVSDPTGATVAAVLLEVQISDRRQYCSTGPNQPVAVPGPCSTVIYVVLLAADYDSCPGDQILAAQASAGYVDFTFRVPTIWAPFTQGVNPAQYTPHWTTNVDGQVDLSNQLTMELDIDNDLKHQFYFYLDPIPINAAARVQCVFHVNVRQGTNVQADGVGHLYLPDTANPVNAMVLDYLIDNTQSYDGGATLPAISALSISENGFTVVLKPAAGELFTITHLESTEYTIRTDITFCSRGTFPRDDSETLVPMYTTIFFNELSSGEQPHGFSGLLSSRTFDNRCFRLQAATEAITRNMTYSSIAVVLHDEPFLFPEEPTTSTTMPDLMPTSATTTSSVSTM